MKAANCEDVKSAGARSVVAEPKTVMMSVESAYTEGFEKEANNDAIRAVLERLFGSGALIDPRVAWEKR